jgi:hypothetical protein
MTADKRGRHPIMKLRREDGRLIRRDRRVGGVRASRRAQASAAIGAAMAPVRLGGRHRCGAVMTTPLLGMHRTIGRALVSAGLYKGPRVRGAGSKDEHEHQRHYADTSMYLGQHSGECYKARPRRSTRTLCARTSFFVVGTYATTIDSDPVG